VIRIDIPFILPHEFLFLVCNSVDRLERLSSVHKPTLKGEFGDIYQWEIADGKPMRVMQELNQMRHIHLLNQGYREDKTAQVLVAGSLDDEAAQKRVTWEGQRPKKLAENAKDREPKKLENRLTDK